MNEARFLFHQDRLLEVVRLVGPLDLVGFVGAADLQSLEVRTNAKSRIALRVARMAQALRGEAAAQLRLDLEGAAELAQLTTEEVLDLGQPIFGDFGTPSRFRR